MSLKFATLDVFTDCPYSGNPVAIIRVPASTTLTQKQKQLIAREFNYSESVILHEQSDEEKAFGEVRIDIFTVFAEVPFAGHPTIGTSNYLLRYLKDDARWQSIKALQTKAGRVPITLEEGGEQVSLEIAHNVRIHSNPFHDRPYGHHPVVSIVKGMTFILAKVDSLDDLAKANGNLLGTDNTYTSKDALDEGWCEGLIGTMFYADLGMSGGIRKIRTRMFGSREDPATGSASGALCSYLSLSEGGDRVRDFHLLQGVEMGRSSDIVVQVTLDESQKVVKQVRLSGTAVKVMEGTVAIPPVEQA